MPGGLTQSNPVSTVRSPMAPSDALASATGRRSSDPGRVTTPLHHLLSLPSDPTDLPDDGVCRMWFRDDLGKIRVAIGGTKYTIDLTAV